jgi:class 3 adenylate cyclase
VGLAVPVTASYIICAVVAAPALMKLGVPDYAAHMFVFYYAVLSEVSPPTALSPFAAAAITGAGPYRTTLMAWKYTLPAFVLPFVFVTDPQGVGLLLNMLPARVAERLKRQDTVADGYTDVTVMFADIVDFTGLSEELAPGDVIYMLNELFTGFDEIAARSGIEKIKTIGDAYMAAGGLNAATPDYTAAVGEAALQMLALMRDRRTPNGAQLALHIGIATGPVGAGVIGRTKFVYDLWGNTVNVASRLSSNAESGQVSVDETTYKRLRGRYRFEGPSFVAAKGKGQITSYFLTGRLLATERVPA